MELEKNPTARKLLKKLLRLEDKIAGKPFPKMRRVKQISVYACGPATLEMLFSFVGVRVSQTSLIRSIRAWNKIKLYGIDVNDMGKAALIAAKKKFIFWRKQKSSVADLDLVVNKYKFPVGVEWQGVFYEFEDEDNGHYGVVTSVDRKAGEVRISDPYPEFAGVDRKFKIGFFTKRWWDINLIKGRRITDKRMMFVITPVGDSWPKKLGMKKA